MTNDKIKTKHVAIPREHMLVMVERLQHHNAFFTMSVKDREINRISLVGCEFTPLRAHGDEGAFRRTEVELVAALSIGTQSSINFETAATFGSTKNFPDTWHFDRAEGAVEYPELVMFDINRQYTAVLKHLKAAPVVQEGAYFKAFDPLTMVVVPYHYYTYHVHQTERNGSRYGLHLRREYRDFGLKVLFLKSKGLDIEITSELETVMVAFNGRKFYDIVYKNITDDKDCKTLINHFVGKLAKTQRTITKTYILAKDTDELDIADLQPSNNGRVTEDTLLNVDGTEIIRYATVEQDRHVHCHHLPINDWILCQASRTVYTIVDLLREHGISPISIKTDAVSVMPDKAKDAMELLTVYGYFTEGNPITLKVERKFLYTPIHYMHEQTICEAAIPLPRDFKEHAPLDWFETAQKDYQTNPQAVMENFKELLEFSKSKITIPDFVQWDSARNRLLPKIKEYEVTRIATFANHAGSGKSTLSEALAFVYASFYNRKACIMKLNFSNKRVHDDDENPSGAKTIFGEQPVYNMLATINDNDADEEFFAKEGVKYVSTTQYSISPRTIGALEGDDDGYMKVGKKGRRIYKVFNGDDFQSLPIQERHETSCSTSLEDMERRRQQVKDFCGRFITLKKCMRDKGGVYEQLRNALTDTSVNALAITSPVWNQLSGLGVNLISPHSNWELNGYDYFVTFTNATASRITSKILGRTQFAIGDRIVSRKDITGVTDAAGTATKRILRNFTFDVKGFRELPHITRDSEGKETSVLKMHAILTPVPDPHKCDRKGHASSTRTPVSIGVLAEYVDISSTGQGAFAYYKCMTVHGCQGVTFHDKYVCIADVPWMSSRNLYVALTRVSNSGAMTGGRKDLSMLSVILPTEEGDYAVNATLYKIVCTNMRNNMYYTDKNRWPDKEPDVPCVEDLCEYVCEVLRTYCTGCRSLLVIDGTSTNISPDRLNNNEGHHAANLRFDLCRHCNVLKSDADTNPEHEKLIRDKAYDNPDSVLEWAVPTLFPCTIDGKISTYSHDKVALKAAFQSKQVERLIAMEGDGRTGLEGEWDEWLNFDFTAQYLAGVV